MKKKKFVSIILRKYGNFTLPTANTTFRGAYTPRFVLSKLKTAEKEDVDEIIIKFIKQ